MKRPAVILFLISLLLFPAVSLGQYLIEAENGAVRGWEYADGEGLHANITKTPPATMEEEPEAEEEGGENTDSEGAEAPEPELERVQPKEIEPEEKEPAKKPDRTESRRIRREPQEKKKPETTPQATPEKKEDKKPQEPKPGNNGDETQAPLRRNEQVDDAPRTNLSEIVMHGIFAGGIVEWEKGDENQKQFDFDFEWPMGHGNTLRYYNTRADSESLRTGLEWKHTRPNGKFRKWEITGFSWTPQMEDSFGLKYSYGKKRKETTFAIVHLPEYDTWYTGGSSTVAGNQDYIFVLSLRKQIAPRFFMNRGKWSSHFSMDREYQVGYIGDVPIGRAMSRIDYTPRVTLTWKPLRRSVFEIAYVNKIHLGEIGYNLVAIKPHRGGSDWLEMLVHDHSGTFSFAQGFHRGELYYNMSTTQEFTREVETLGLKYGFTRDFNLALEYVRDRGYNDFLEVPNEEVTRVSLTKKLRRNYEAGLLFESRRGEQFTGLQLYTEGAGGNRLPDTIYRDMEVPDLPFRDEFYAGDYQCDQLNSMGLDYAISTLNSAYEVASLSSCLNRPGYLEDFYRVSPPWDVMNGELANCISTSWLQAYILNRNGYEAYPVGLQASQMAFGNTPKDKYDVMHAIVVYRRPGWDNWWIMEYNEVAATTGKTIEEALRAYDPGYLGFTVFDPDDLMMLGTYSNATLEEIDHWIADED